MEVSLAKQQTENQKIPLNAFYNTDPRLVGSIYFSMQSDEILPFATKSYLERDLFPFKALPKFGLALRLLCTVQAPL